MACQQKSERTLDVFCKSLSLFLIESVFILLSLRDNLLPGLFVCLVPLKLFFANLDFETLENIVVYRNFFEPSHGIPVQPELFDGPQRLDSHRNEGEQVVICGQGSQVGQ